jgi:hypothetical protein
MRLFTKLVFAVVLATSVVMIAGTQLASAQPTAMVTLWQITIPIGFNPNEQEADLKGVTSHVAAPGAPLTIATNIENSNNPGGPCGLIFWNPATNDFKDYGVTGGFTAGLDIDLTGPTLAGPGGATFQAGDTWVSVQTGFRPLYVNFKGSDNFRSYPVGTGGVNGVAVDQSSGKVWFTDEFSGTINRLDPTTDTVDTFLVGGTPHYLAVDKSGRAYGTVSLATVAGFQDAIVRIDPTATIGNVTAWPVGALSFSPSIVSSTFSTPDGIDLQSDGLVDFVETQSNEFGRLDPAGNMLAEITKPGVDEPQQIAASGSGAGAKAFATEAHGESTDIIEWPAASPVTPITATVAPVTTIPGHEDFTETPRRQTITPITVGVPGVDPPGIVRFTPMPPPAGGTSLADRDPSGITDVIATNKVAGSYLDEMFANNSAVYVLESEAIGPPPPPEEQPAAKVTGGGSVAVTGGKGTFGFVVQRKETNGPITGELQYNNHVTGANVHSIEFTDLSAATKPGPYSFGGTCSLKFPNVPAVEVTCHVEGQDMGEPGTSDSFTITYGVITEGGTLTGGNIYIHKAKT